MEKNKTLLPTPCIINCFGKCLFGNLLLLAISNLKFMTYQDVFIVFWEQVKESIAAGTFAKLTMAKTIGKPELKNIFLRPIYSDDGFKVMLKYSFRLRETEDIEEEIRLEDSLTILKSHLKTPFLSVLLFSTTKDVVFKVNNKGVGSIAESHPTFKNVT